MSKFTKIYRNLSTLMSEVKEQAKAENPKDNDNKDNSPGERRNIFSLESKGSGAGLEKRKTKRKQIPTFQGLFVQDQKGNKDFEAELLDFSYEGLAFEVDCKLKGKPGDNLSFLIYLSNVDYIHIGTTMSNRRDLNNGLSRIGAKFISSAQSTVSFYHCLRFIELVAQLDMSNSSLTAMENFNFQNQLKVAKK